MLFRNIISLVRQKGKNWREKKKDHRTASDGPIFYWQHTPHSKNYISSSMRAATTATMMMNNRVPQPEPLRPLL